MPAPPPIQVRQRITQEVHGFLGVNLRQERMSLADQDVAKAINADLHTFPGVLTCRLGRTAQFVTPLVDLAIRRLARVNAVRYQVAGQSLYRDQTRIVPGTLSSNLITTIKPFRSLNEASVLAYIADDSAMRKDDGTTLTTWGLAAPLVAPSAAASTGAGNLSGAYQVRYTWARKVGATIAQESNPSPASASLSLTAQNIEITSLQASADPQVTHTRIYRTLSGGLLFLFDQEVAVGVTTVTSSQTDDGLGAAVGTGNNAPPVCSWIEEFQETMFFCRDAAHPNYLWFSQRFLPQYVPAGNFLEIGNPNDPLQAAVASAGLLGVFSQLTKYRVFGSAIGGYVAQEAMSHRGTPAPLACVATEGGILFVARDGIFLTSLIAQDQNLSETIAPLFFGESVNGMLPIRWEYAEQFSAAYFKGRYYVSLVTGSATGPNLLAVYSTDTRRWYFYDHPLRSLYVEDALDDLVGGGLDGLAYVLEDGTADGATDIALDVETKDFFGQSTETRKLFVYARVDADVPSGSLSVEVYVDGVLKRTATVTGSRTRRLLPLPAACMGFTWRLRLRYTGQERVKIYGAAVTWVPLEPS